jgi:MATE family multidrug resistance protein
MEYSNVPITEEDIEPDLQLPIPKGDGDDDIDFTTEESQRAIPVCIGYIFMFLNGFITMTFAGHLKDSSIFAGISLANMYANVSFLSLILGMSSAVDTLASQNYGAAKYVEVGIVLQRSCVVCIVVSIPFILTWFFSEDLFMLAHVKRPVATVVQDFLLIRVVCAPFDIIDVSYEKYLSAIGVVNPPLFANIAQNITLALFNYLFLYVLKLDYRYLAWSFVISSITSLVVMVSTSYYHPAVQKTLQPLNFQAFSRWLEFASLGFPATLMLCSEWWAFEILTFLASQLGTPEVAAQTIIIQIASLAYMVPLGISISTASLVGNFIGAGKTSVAIKLGKLAILFDIFCQIILGILIYFCGHYLVDSYTPDQHIRSLCYLILPFLSCFTLIDGLVAIGSGILRAVGKQQIGAFTNIISFYGIGLPMAFFLCFHTSFHVRGLIMGLSFGTGFQMTILLALVLIWEKYIYKSSIVSNDSDFRTIETVSRLFKLNQVESQEEKDEQAMEDESLKPFYIEGGTIDTKIASSSV